MLITSSNPIDEGILIDLQNLYFRQSMINDYLTCPHMCLLTWVIDIPQQSQFMSAILGTAGHKVIFMMHENRRFDYSDIELLQMMSEYFDEEINVSEVLPTIGVSFNSIEEEKMEKLPDYVEMLRGYQKMESQRNFTSSMHEQSFVLEVKDSLNEDEPPYLFTGQIDQAGFINEGDLILRDIKFRDNAFKPSRNEFMLNTQMTIYAAALKYGKPACPKCKPFYNKGELGMDKRLVYNGPCEDCNAKIGTYKWPQKIPLRCELIWMHDFKQRKKDQYPPTIKDKNGPKVPNPKGKGPKVYADIPNPEYGSGYHEGDIVGQGYIPTNRTGKDISILMGDILQACRSMRKGVFYRKPGDACNFWCKHTAACQAGIETQVKNSVITLESSFRDPFASI